MVAIYAPQFLSTYLGIVQGTMASAVATGALAGAAGGAIMTGTLKGTLKGALFGAISAGVAYGIGEALGHQGGSIFSERFNPTKGIAKALAHGLSRAVIAKAQGGRLRGGFWSGFASSALSPLTSSASTLEGKVALSAIVGGTASELGGGKFANGAVTAAFVMMYNEMGHRYATVQTPTPAEMRGLEARFNEPGLTDVSELFVPIGRVFSAIANTFKAALIYYHITPYSPKIITQMNKGGWTEEKVFEALKTNGIEATGKINPATRYVNPHTGKSIIIDNVTKELFHAGRKSDYRY